ncbi:IclR family transcriptional regulator [Pseudaminobacter salicylatoxidans]|uniref:IclR family transcriptional regulator n=1 Tax=Pseudaminobacter salicylatoxidans TaxID=93369 RepID=UPI0003090228|nr:IclR family transcriptional regulator C-terminal domain-containing protein [Pseudaminobacter salicylatoxidans]
MAKVERRGIQSIEVGGRLLSALVKAGGPMMLRDLATEADLAPAQAHAYLSSFRRVELVEQDGESGRYTLGPMALRLGLARMKSTRPLQHTSVAAADLSQSLGLMVAVVIWGPHAPTAIQVREGTQSLNINIRPGTTFDVTGSPSGRVFAAYEKTADVKQRIEAEFGGAFSTGAGRLPSRSAFAAGLARIRKCGYCGAEDSPVPGLCTVAAPVFDEDGKLLLALSLTGSSEVLDPSSENPAVVALLSLARSLSDDAGYPQVDARGPK